MERGNTPLTERRLHHGAGLRWPRDGAALRDRDRFPRTKQGAGQAHARPAPCLVSAQAVAIFVESSVPIAHDFADNHKGGP